MRIARNIGDAGPALFRLVRFWARRWINESVDDHAVDVLVLEAIDAAAGHGPVSVGDVAAEIGMDRSGASRFVSAAVGRGHVARTASTADARRAELTITDQGAALLTAARRWQRDVFVDLVADWPAADAERFAGYLQRLAHQQLTSTRDQEPT